MKKSILSLCTLVLGASMFAMGQQAPSSSAPAGSTPPTFPSDQSRPAPDTTAPVPQSAPDASNPAAAPSSASPSASQDSAAQSASQDSSAMGAGSTITGCLSQASSGSGFTLTDSTGATFILQGDSKDLAKHVGEQVEVHGSTNPASSSSAGSAAAPAGAADSAQSASAASGASKMLDVKSVSKISSTCEKAK